MSWCSFPPYSYGLIAHRYGSIWIQALPCFYIAVFLLCSTSSSLIEAGNMFTTYLLILMNELTKTFKTTCVTYSTLYCLRIKIFMEYPLNITSGSIVDVGLWVLIAMLLELMSTYQPTTQRGCRSRMLDRALTISSRTHLMQISKQLANIPTWTEVFLYRTDMTIYFSCF